MQERQHTHTVGKSMRICGKSNVVGGRVRTSLGCGEGVVGGGEELDE